MAKTTLSLSDSRVNLAWLISENRVLYSFSWKSYKRFSSLGRIFVGFGNKSNYDAIRKICHAKQSSTQWPYLMGLKSPSDF